MSAPIPSPKFVNRVFVFSPFNPIILPTAANPSNDKKNAAIDAPKAGMPANTIAPAPPVAAVIAPRTPPAPTSAPKVLTDLSLRESIATPKVTN